MAVERRRYSEAGRAAVYRAAEAIGERQLEDRVFSDAWGSPA
ncbi:MAG: hypothetical protein ACYCTY_07070 [Sulfuricella sp.]